MSTVAWLVVGAMAGTGLLLALVKRIPRRVPEPAVEKITSMP